MCHIEGLDPYPVFVIYRKNLLRITRDRRELVKQVRVTLHHELGLHGLDDDELRELGLE